jgi:hypothetical protein
MNPKSTFEQINSIHLAVPITEAILLSCLNGSSFSEIDLSVQKVVPTSKLILRKYIFHLVEKSFITYRGHKRKYVIETDGLNLLQRIYSHCKSRKASVSYSDLVIEIK